MMEGQTDDLRTSTDVIPKIPDQTLGAIADFTQQIVDQSEQSKIHAAASSAQLDLSALSNDYQIKNQSDPLGGLDDYKTQRQAILDKYGDNISPFFQQEWTNKAQDLSESNDASMQVWGLKQAKDNTVLNMNSSLRDSFTLANQNGAQFGQSGGDISSMLNFAQAKQNIQQFGNDHLGATTTADMLFNFNKDYAKSFVAGVASTSPQRAAQLMQDPQIKDQFTSEEQDQMIGLIKTTDKAQQLDQSYSQGMKNADVTDLINNTQLNYFQKRQQIDQMDLNGEISSKVAAQARRVLTSSKNVDSVTDQQLMSDTVTSMYDLNANSTGNNSDYLKGVENIQAGILKAQNDGKLSVIDASKLNNQLRTLTSARVSSATQSVGNTFYDANQTFNVLPPEQRGAATRQLFDWQYNAQQNGPPPSKQQMAAQAHVITDNINTQRRAAAQATIAKTSGLTVGGGFTSGALSDDDLQVLKDNGFTQDDAKETAQRYGLNPGDVVNRLRKGK